MEEKKNAKKHKKWTQREIEDIKASYGVEPIDRIAARLGRTKCAVSWYARSIGLRCVNQDRERVVRIVIEHYADMTNGEIEEQFGIPRRQIRNISGRLKLRKTEEALNRAIRERADKISARHIYDPEYHKKVLSNLKTEGVDLKKYIEAETPEQKADRYRKLSLSRKRNTREQRLRLSCGIIDGVNRYGLTKELKEVYDRIASKTRK